MLNHAPLSIMVVWLRLLLLISLTIIGIAFTSASTSSIAISKLPNGGATSLGAVLQEEYGRENATVPVQTDEASIVFSSPAVSSGGFELPDEGRPLRVLFLSSDTGGGHRASAEALGEQFQLLFPGSTYDLVDIWTLDGVFPYNLLVDSYTHLSAHPNQWRLFYHVSNTFINEFLSNFHSGVTCERKIRRRIASYDPDVVVSVHPTMNRTPIISVKRLSKKHGKHIPFFTVVTDLGSGHSMWFQKNVEKLYIASDRIKRLARRRGGTSEDRIVMTGLPIRHDFALQAQALGDRNSAQGRNHQKAVRKELKLDPSNKVVLLMAGGEGVGPLGSIVESLYPKLATDGINATICVICGKNIKLKEELEQRDWEEFLAANSTETASVHQNTSGYSRERILGRVEVVALGYVDRMPEYMVAADVLVTKAGPGTIAEAAAVGLPTLLTSFLPGQEAGNVDVVVDAEFGAFARKPSKIATVVSDWLQDEEKLRKMSLNSEKIGHAKAASDIVRDIGDITHTWMKLNGPRKSINASAVA